MTVSDPQIASTPPAMGVDKVWDGANEPAWHNKLLADSEFRNVLATFATTLTIFAIYMVQGVLVARILGVVGRGEFGTAMFFPRDVFLYAGLMGGIEIVNSYAVTGALNVRSLKYSAAKVGLISGIFTAIVAGSIAVTVMVLAGKSYLIPFCLLCCLFVPFEHMQLTISAVDRGTKNFWFYNVNRLIFALSFLILVAVVFGLGLNTLTGLGPLTVICVLFVVARIVGILPTLRGMKVWSTLLGKEVEAETSDVGTVAGMNEPGVEEGEVEVPSAWQLLIKGRFYALSMLASELFERLDMFLIVAIATVGESGYYFVAVPAAQLLTVAPNALGVFTFNAGAEKERVVSLKKAITVVSATAALQFISALILAIILPFLIVALYTNDFAAAIPFALWLLPACAIKGYLQAVDGYLKGRGKPMIGVVARFLSIFVMLGFVGLVYSDVIPFEQKLISIPMAACIGQAISMVIITVAVIRDVLGNQTDDNVEVSNVHV